MNCVMYLFHLRQSYYNSELFQIEFSCNTFLFLMRQTHDEPMTYGVVVVVVTPIVVIFLATDMLYVSEQYK